jgi:DNA polymerase (family 10)
MTNGQLANELRDLRDFLIIAGYEESHATRYTQIARYIERMPESVEQMKREGRLSEIPGVGKLIKLYIKEYLETGTCSKRAEWASAAPDSVLELVRIPGVGAKTARFLFKNYGVYSLEALKLALDEGRLDDAPGIGPKTLTTMREYADAHSGK